MTTDGRVNWDEGKESAGWSGEGTGTSSTIYFRALSLQTQIYILGTGVRGPREHASLNTFTGCAQKIVLNLFLSII